jgi:hypothetical protein
LCFNTEELIGYALNIAPCPDLLEFCAAVSANRILEGEMFRMTLSKSKNGNAQHLRVASVVPLRSGFLPAIESLRELYGERVGS